jgi:hypothetical protein
LYEKQLYARVADDGGGVRWLSDLFVQPCGDTRPFRPKYENWRRKNKVPILVLNATTINTGHNWQFTASWMGEPPAGIDAGIDGNYRLRRMYYREAPDPYKRLRLGYAVAASSCVPGLFEPLMLRGLYPGKYALLVDGGVHDNQGVSSLLEQDCTVMIVSDASGQMGTQDHPRGGRLDVLFRTNDMLMRRVRQAEYQDLEARQSTGLLRGRLFLHLKKDLPVEPVDWKYCDDPSEPAARPGDAEPRRPPATPYGIPVELQRHLSAVRTDLDAFSDVEAYALMTSGYRMAEAHFDQDLPGAVPAPEPTPWRFLELEAAMLAPGAAGKDVLKQVKAGREKFFRIWRLSPILSMTAVLLGIGAIIALGRLWRHHLTDALRTSVGTLGWGVISLAAALFTGRLLVVLLRNRMGTPVGRFGVVNLALLLGFLAFKLQRYLGLNWLSLQRGSLKRVLSVPR